MNKLLTANGVAEVLGIDRRSVMLRLGDVPPDGRCTAATLGRCARSGGRATPQETPAR